MVSEINNVSQQPRDRNIFERNPKKTLFLSIIILFILVEFIGHFIYYFTHDRSFVFDKTNFVKFTPYGLMKYKPNSKIPLPGYPAPLETDQYGFVDNGYKRPIGPDEYLIFLVGGSLVEGRGSSSNAATIAACLEKILNRQAGKNKFRVINAGFAGHTSYQQLSVIEGEILPNFKPKMVIALDGHNDGWYAVSWKQWHTDWQPYFDQITRDVNRNMEPGFGVVIDVIKRHSIIAATFEKIRQKVFHPDANAYTQVTLPPDERLEAAAKGYLVNQLLAREILQQYDIKYYAFLQPFLAKYLKRNIRPDEAKIMQQWGSEYKDSDIFYGGMEKYYELVEQKTGKLPFYYDLSKLFMDKSQTLYVDHCHFNDEGNQMIAQSIADILWPHLAKVQ